jgi:hypothetical protein
MPIYFDDDADNLRIVMDDSLEPVDEFEPLSEGGVCPAFDPNSEAAMQTADWFAWALLKAGHHGSRLSQVVPKRRFLKDRLIVRTERWLGFLMSTQSAESFIGDLEERTLQVCKEKGRIRATLYFWVNLIRSLPPIVFRSITTEEVQNTMLDLGSILKNHEFMWSGDGPSLARDYCFYYHRIAGKNIAHKVSVINAGLRDRPDWYYWIFVNDNQVVAHHHFKSPEQALEDALNCSNEMPEAPRLREFEWYSGRLAYTVDGLRKADVTILEFALNDWRYQAVEDHKRIWWTGPFSTAEDALAGYLESLKVN